jgi:hypothetical protein
MYSRQESSTCQCDCRSRGLDTQRFCETREGLHSSLSTGVSPREMPDLAANVLFLLQN